MKILRIAFTRDRMKLDVQMEEGEPLFTNDALAALALKRYPTLGAHSCINNAGPTFGHVIAQTSVPHLLEHMIIAEQVERAHQSEFPYVGTTEWVGNVPTASKRGIDALFPDMHEGQQDADAQPALAHVEVSYTDDVAAITALHHALEAWHNIITPYDSYDQ